MPSGVYMRTEEYRKKIKMACARIDRKKEKNPAWRGGIAKTHTGRWRAKNKEHVAVYNREWVEKNRERKYYINNRRRAILLNAQGSHTLEEWLKLKEATGKKCVCCGRLESEVVITEDHVVPLSIGGSDSIENIQPLCRNCNSKKYNKIISYV